MENTIDKPTNNKTKSLKSGVAKAKDAMKDKKKRTTIVIVCAIVAIVAVGTALLIKGIQYANFSYQTILQLEERIGKPDEKWSVTTTDPKIATAEFKTDMGFEGYSLVIDFHRPSSTDLIVKNADGQEFRYQISINQDKVIDVQSK